jgi:hypothetical protein
MAGVVGALLVSAGTSSAAAASAGVWSDAGNSGRGWVVGDFNGDGKDDLLRQTSQWGGAEVFVSTGSMF